MKKSTTYEQVADKAGLTGVKKNRFIEYMNMRWGIKERELCVYGYAEEWADRFQRSMEWIMADEDGRKVLANMDKALVV